MPDDLYERDILIWSEQQADLLRRLAAGERVKEAVDWVNLIEELEDVGRAREQACERYAGASLREVPVSVLGAPHEAADYAGTLGKTLGS